MTTWRDVVFVMLLMLAAAVVSSHLPLDCEPECTQDSGR
jgi:hypothetical protein